MEGGFLPPEPGGPEPELGDRPARSRQPPPPPAPPGWAPPEGAVGGPPPPQQPWQQQPQWGGPREPDNGSAVAGFSLSLASIGLLIPSAGLSSIISVVCAGLGIMYSRRGRAAVDRGETAKHAGLAQAGFVIGIIGTVLSVLATVFWIVIGVLLATDDDFRQEFEDELDGGGGGGSDFFDFETSAVLMLRGLLSLLA